jgi:Fe2+ transport system protein FeoA
VAATERGADIEVGKSDGRESGGGLSTLALTDLADGESGRIVRLSGDERSVGRLKAMGLVAGARVAKKSAALRRGPVVVEGGGSQLALAYEIAAGVLVEPLGRAETR